MHRSFGTITSPEQRRNLLALLVAMLVLPFVRFLEEWSRPAFRGAVTNGNGTLRFYSGEVRVFLGGEEIRGFSSVEYTHLFVDSA